MSAFTLDLLTPELKANVLDRYRAEFQEHVKKTNVDLSNFQDFAIKALTKIGVVGLVAPLSSTSEFTINELDGNLIARIRELPTPTDKWEQELQCFVHDWIQMTVGRFGVNLSIGASPVELEEGIKAFLKWHEEFNLSMFNLLHSAIFKKTVDKFLF